jgi:hypothetical protein
MMDKNAKNIAKQALFEWMDEDPSTQLTLFTYLGLSSDYLGLTFKQKQECAYWLGQFHAALRLAMGSEVFRSLVSNIGADYESYKMEKEKNKPIVRNINGADYRCFVNGDMVSIENLTSDLLTPFVIATLSQLIPHDPQKVFISLCGVAVAENEVVIRFQKNECRFYPNSTKV